MSVWTWPFLSISMFTNLDVSFGERRRPNTFFNQVSVQTLVLRLEPLIIAHFLSGMRRESVCASSASSGSASRYAQILSSMRLDRSFGLETPTRPVSCDHGLETPTRPFSCDRGK